MTEKQTGALAIFVKTPGFSPIKTRLAESIGKESAEHFHRLAALAVESVVHQAAGLRPSSFTPHWAVAENNALSARAYRNFQVIWQGQGSLGERLSRVYDELIHQHAFVIFIGADSPQLSSGLLVEASSLLARSVGASFLIGRALDGGFYLFGGAGPIPRSVWLDVPYSAPNTAEVLASHLQELGQVVELPQLMDVDTAEDMKQLAATSLNAAHTEEQRQLLAWVRRYFGERK